MSADVTNEMECSRKFLEHRAALPAGALTPYAGRWIAWSPRTIRCALPQCDPRFRVR